MGANYGELVYYIVEILAFSAVAYMFLLKTDHMMENVFKKKTANSKNICYLLGLVGVANVVKSVFDAYSVYKRM